MDDAHRDDEGHLSPALVARLLDGTLGREELLRDVLPHHLARCEPCRASYRELLRRQNAGLIANIPVLPGWEEEGG
jgi:hypothetical protein